MDRLSELEQMIVNLRHKLNDLSSNTDSVSRDEIIRCGRELNELIKKYHALKKV